MADTMKVEEELHRFQETGPGPDQEGDLVVLEEAAHLFRVSEVDGRRPNPRPQRPAGANWSRAEACTTLPRMVEGEVAHGGVVLVLQDFEPVHDGMGRRYHVVAHARA